MDPIGPLSPSASLLVERRDLAPTRWQTHLLEDQLLHLFLNWLLVERRGHRQDTLRLSHSVAQPSNC